MIVDNNKTEKIYLSGKKLYGDDFSLSEIETWYNNEKEGYANLLADKKKKYRYGYHKRNIFHAFGRLPKNASFTNALGIGSAYGDEFLPVINRISNLFIVEPSDNLVSDRLGNITPVYVKPTLSGQLNFPDNHFDLITCFSALHHIPNVSYVMSELYRCLKPGGYLLMHEPIQSMGDWSRARRGLTKNERGIPLTIFRKIIKHLDFIIVKETFCSSFIRKINRRFIYNNFYLGIDKIISRILSFEAPIYHRKTLFSKLAPGAVYYILTK